MGPEILVLLVLAAAVKAGSPRKPVLVFRPNYDKYLQGDKIKMTCNARPTERTYRWYHNNNFIAEGETYEIAKAEKKQSGGYQCQNKNGTKSEIVTLNVVDGLLALQTSPYIFEGERLLLRCYHRPNIDAKRSAFFKDKAVIQNWSDANVFTKQAINKTASGSYTCTKEVSMGSGLSLISANVSVFVRDLFTTPEIQVTPYPVKIGKKVILTCHTNVSKYSPSTEPWYGFYKDKQNIQKFSPINQFEIQSFQRGGSGRYSCGVTPKTSSVTKISKEVLVNSSNKTAFTQNIVECVLIISIMFIFIM
ncbi:high affinity immunoglobulin gamma Fc receptor I-like [Pyxicephalus adspersus]|uniref:high affinity immunoglobulin gamma Fc receptor I-like n=1 Tax=Pyxicephalus adspersus TaxID=30357 RepID=UPI003B5BF000